MKKENSSKEFYLQRLNKNQSNSQKNPLKFLAFYVDRNKNRKQHVGSSKGRDTNRIAKAVLHSYYRKNIKPMFKAA